MKNIGKTTQVALAVAFLVGSSGCAALSMPGANTPVTTREQGAGIGALSGGAAGAIIGSVTGSAVTGGLIGMPLGALAGYYIGDNWKTQPAVGDDYPGMAKEGRTSVTFGDVLFEFDKADVKKDGMPYVNPLIAFLKDHPSRKVWIEGHTDNVGTGAYNLDLSTKRAESVRDVLVKAGINPHRIAAKGIGEAKPLASNDTAAGRTMNRRVEVDVF